MNRLLFAALGPVLAVAGWNAWTGRWRSWAHPYSVCGNREVRIYPRLMIEATDVHQLAFQPRSARSVAARLRALETALEVPAAR